MGDRDRLALDPQVPTTAVGRTLTSMTDIFT
jgi:hypothetical protein